MRIGNEQRCYQHALERGNELRAGRGLAPVTVDDQGGVHVVHGYGKPPAFRKSGHGGATWRYRRGETLSSSRSMQAVVSKRQNGGI